MAAPLKRLKIACVWLFLPLVEGKYKYCWHPQDGDRIYFYCGVYQTCCGDKCCDDLERFYRLWYFWLCVLLLLVICSGGGYWMRRRYFVHQLFATEPPRNVPVPPRQVGNGYRTLSETPHTPPTQLPDAPPPYSTIFVNNTNTNYADVKPPPYLEALPSYEETVTRAGNPLSQLPR